MKRGLEERGIYMPSLYWWVHFHGVERGASPHMSCSKRAKLYSAPVREQCNKEFDSTKSLDYHVRYYHGEYVCPDCGQSFSSYFNLDYHKQKSSRKDIFWLPRMWRRFLCSKHPKHTLNKHIRNVHQNKQDFKCVTCGKGFGQKFNLMILNKILYALVATKDLGGQVSCLDMFNLSIRG